MPAKNKNIAVLLPNFFNAKQFNAIKSCIASGGSRMIVVGLKRGDHLTDKLQKQVVIVDMAAENVRTSEIDAVIILDSSTPEEMKASRRNLNLISKSYNRHKVVGAVDRGVELLVAALGSLMSERNVTGPAESRTYLESAGAFLVDQDVVVDSTLITARSTEDTEKFCKALLELVSVVGGIAA